MTYHVDNDSWCELCRKRVKATGEDVCSPCSRLRAATGAAAAPVTVPHLDLRDGTDDMIHVLVECCEPFTRTLCGQARDSAATNDDGSYDRHVPVDCVVCYQMDQQVHNCPNCGGPVGG